MNILQHQYETVQHENNANSKVDYDSTYHAAKFAVYVVLNQKSGNIDLEYYWITASMKNKGQDDFLLKQIVKLFFKPLPLEKQVKGVQLKCYTEYTRQGTTFRCHPNYKNEGPWHDYAFVAWDNPSSEKCSNSQLASYLDCNKEILEMPVITQESKRTSNVLLIPAKIICFVQDCNDNMNALIHSCHEHSAKMSVLTYRWQLEYEGDIVMKQNIHPSECNIDATKLTPIFHAVSVDTLQKHCLMLPYDVKTKCCFLMQVIDQHK